jgi:predicted  nucleic acid-binding Zn-ribbon protein
MTAFGAAGKEGITELQDARIAELERNQYQIAVALGNIQANLAAIQTNLDTKVAKSDVDPAVVELNEALSKARVRMEEFSKETDEAVKAGKDEFKNLPQKIQKTIQ